MQVALLTTFAVTKEERLSVLLERIHTAFLTSGLGEPSILFTLSDPPVPGASSTIDRPLKKYPDFARFISERSGSDILPGPMRLMRAARHEILRDVEGEWSAELGPKHFTQLKAPLLRVWESSLIR
jgi:hypothetical protein